MAVPFQVVFLADHPRPTRRQGSGGGPPPQDLRTAGQPPRFADDPHIWASALYDEVSKLGYGLSYVSFVRQLRTHKLRPHCEACSGVRGRPTTQIDHPPGAELQWDW